MTGSLESGQRMKGNKSGHLEGGEKKETKVKCLAVK